jgi:flagellar L-ring protein FlgH
MRLFSIALRTTVAAVSLAAAAASAQSLYDEKTFQALTGDHKAHRVGDVVTVLIHEDASAVSTADTKTERNNGVSVRLDSPFHHRFIVGSHTGAFRTSLDFDGAAGTHRAGRLLAQLTLTVREVLPNGALVLSGEQSLEINNERQQISVEGKARAQDISEQNEILSFRLADAKITYQGAGDVALAQRPGWWARLLAAFGL